jgi:hypothetical protein
VNDKQKHLEFIQNVISRMASNLFFLRGWAITLIAALFALFVKEAKNDAVYIYIAYAPAIICWILDGYFLSQERLFRALYDHVRKLKNTEIDFSMDTQPFHNNKQTNWFFCMFAPTLRIFYFPLVGVMVFITLYQIYR